MTCDHCAKDLEDALNGLPGVKAQVSYPQGIAEVQAGEELDIKQLLRVMKVKGYGVNPMEGQP
jgi:mercuric reductase